MSRHFEGGPWFELELSTFTNFALGLAAAGGELPLLTDARGAARVAQRVQPGADVALPAARVLGAPAPTGHVSDMCPEAEVCMVKGVDGSNSQRVAECFRW